MQFLRVALYQCGSSADSLYWLNFLLEIEFDSLMRLGNKYRFFNASNELLIALIVIHLTDLDKILQSENYTKGTR